jgi:hypothetical protein
LLRSRRRCTLRRSRRCCTLLRSRRCRCSIYGRCCCRIVTSILYMSRCCPLRTLCCTTARCWFCGLLLVAWLSAFCFRASACFRSRSCRFGLLSGIWEFRCVSHEEDSLLSDDAPQVALEISLHSHKKGLSPFLQEERGQTLVGAVPGMTQSALTGVVAMVFLYNHS